MYSTKINQTVNFLTCVGLALTLAGLILGML